MAPTYQQLQDENESLKRQLASANEKLECLVTDKITSFLDDPVLNLLTDHLPVLISYVDSEHRYQFNNAIYEEWFEKPRDLVYGKKVKDVLGEQAYQTILPYIEGVLEGKVQRYSSYVPYETGGRHINAIYVPHWVKGVVNGFFVLVSDVSQEVLHAEQLTQSLKLKESLLQEIHHRVKNNLQMMSSLIQLQSKYVFDETALGILDNCRNRIQTIAMIHQHLYDEERIGEESSTLYIEDLVKLVCAVHEEKDRSVVLESSFDDVKICLQQSVSIGIIINEIIENTFKHAFDRVNSSESLCLLKINIKLDKNSKVSLAIEDNGLGIPDDIDLNNPATMGFRLISMMVMQLGGTLDINRKNPTRFTVKFVPEGA